MGLKLLRKGFLDENNFLRLQSLKEKDKELSKEKVRLLRNDKTSNKIEVIKKELKIYREQMSELNSTIIKDYTPIKIHKQFVMISFDKPNEFPTFYDNQNIEPHLIEIRPDYKKRNWWLSSNKTHSNVQIKDMKVVCDYKYYVYKNNLYCFDWSDIHTEDEQKLLIKEHYFKEEKKFQRLRKEIKLYEKLELAEVPQSREPIPEEVKFVVWRRDGGRCVKCGSKENLEFDHIIPLSKGGSNTERNIQLLCEKCNREKSDKI